MMRFAVAASALIAAALASGCGREPSTPPAQGNAAGSESLRQGDVTVHATAVQTDKLPEQVVRRYGAARDARTVLLVVSLRRGDDANSVALSAQRIEASATDLLGRKQSLTLREMRDGELVDYVATVRLSPPDTLRFDVAAHAGGERYRLKFVRDFF